MQSVYSTAPSRQPDLKIIITKKREFAELWICCPGGAQSKIERIRKDELVHRPCLGIEKTVKHVSDIIPILISALGTVTKGLIQD